MVNQGDSDECVYRISPEDLDSTGEMFVLAAQHLIAQNIDTDDEVCGA
ncbi:hypothetical protein GL4_1992 [Methyloceanibacter caenitepidi]|uniref:Uncharacterized protein n=1 Tax=Methyloceanibacter caenitepidi TaxID=1384459 RepID=A0A0A8K3V2_9HYPH|nr:hypothetical protein GL4_1992 [Methyloceanibacter caenitepidi]